MLEAGRAFAPPSSRGGDVSSDVLGGGGELYGNAFLAPLGLEDCL